MSKQEKNYKGKEHQLFISSVWHWIKLRRENKISPKARKIARKIFWISFLTAPFRWLQSVILWFRLPGVSLDEKPPVFVIGHWRSGTTHLHYLLAQDKQFSFLETFQAFLFRIAFVSKGIMKPILGAVMPTTRPQDNIKIDKNSPQEEDHCLTNISEKSGMQTFYFPNNISYFDKWNVFKGGVTEKEKNQWKKIYCRMLKQIALYQGKDKRLLLKNPNNTGRIEVLLELFAESKFIFIHRNPYDVYISTKHLYDSAISSQWLQEFSNEQVEERVLYIYEESMKTYLEHRSKIPKEHLIEIGFDELELTAEATVEKIYTDISLGDFEAIKPAIAVYLETVKNYKKNKQIQLPDHIKSQINTRWKFAFEEWGYEME
ncbi:MAG: sulfotransferase [Flavobacteriales bacterium]|nr:sulfotransferase [Flavobacteriales bacterium]